MVDLKTSGIFVGFDLAGVILMSFTPYQLKVINDNSRSFFTIHQIALSLVIPLGLPFSFYAIVWTRPLYQATDGLGMFVQ